jgi:putative transposase
MGLKIKGTPPRLTVIFSSFPLYFVTFNTLARVRLLDNGAIHTAFQAYTQRGVKLGAATGRYVIMPDHVHLFVRIADRIKLGQWVKGLKRHLDEVLIRMGNTPQRVPIALSAGDSGHYSKLKSFWQPGFFDHVLRHDESYSEKWLYVCMNPVRAGLVERHEDWPYQGEIVRIDRA